MLVCYDGRLYIKYRTKIGRARMCVIFHALTNSSLLDDLNIFEMDEHDKIFTPQNVAEKIFWDGSREMLKREKMRAYKHSQASKLGGRPRKYPEKEKGIRRFYQNCKKSV